MNKKLLYITTISAVTLAAVGAIAISSVSAASITGTSNPMSNLVSAIATKFNLNPADVQQVFNDQKAKMQAQMQQKETDRINAAVTAGKLTQDQANKIIAKKAELQTQEAAFKASLEGKTKAEIQAAIKAQMDALKQWATDNNIPLQYLMGFGGLRWHGGFGFGHHQMMGQSPTGTPATSVQ